MLGAVCHDLGKPATTNCTICTTNPDDGNPIAAKTLEEGMGQLYVQVQNVEHKIIFPNEIAESKLRPSPWW